MPALMIQAGMARNNSQAAPPRPSRGETRMTAGRDGFCTGGGMTDFSLHSATCRKLPAPATPPPPPPRNGEGRRTLLAPPLRFGEGAGGRGCLLSVFSFLRRKVELLRRRVQPRPHALVRSTKRPTQPDHQTQRDNNDPKEDRQEPAGPGGLRELLLGRLRNNMPNQYRGFSSELRALRVRRLVAKALVEIAD